MARDKYWGDGIRWILNNVTKASDDTELVTIANVYLLGVVFFLGAYDAADATRGAVYASNLADFMDTSGASTDGPREALKGAATKNDVPVVIVRSENYFNLDGTNHASPHPAKPEIDTVRTAQESSVTTISGAGGEVALVSCDNAPRQDPTGFDSSITAPGTGEHMTGRGSWMLGDAVASAISTMTPLQSPSY